MSAPWVQRLRELHDESFSADHDWAAHMPSLNRSIGATGLRELATPAPGLPPSWFVGDVENLRPDRWVLFVGLNQARVPGDEPWHLAQRYTPQTSWDYWRLVNVNSETWNTGYYRPRARLAASALGVEVPREREREFATAHIVFVEICPYSSERFQFADEDLLRLSAQDHGFRTAAALRRILIQHGRPAMVMVSGYQAVTVLERADDDHLTLGRVRSYQSVSRPEKRLWHREGHYTSGASHMPVMGFPFLRTQSAHNSYEEIDQLGKRAGELVRESRE